MGFPQLNIYETNCPVNVSGFMGNGSSQFSVNTGSRLILTLQVDSIDVGAVLTLAVTNNFEQASTYDTLDTISATSAGRIKRVYSDFNNFFILAYTVTGGNATFRVGITIADNAQTNTIASAEVTVDINAAPDASGKFSSVRIGNGAIFQRLNSDGSVPTTVERDPDDTAVNTFAEVSAVPIGVETQVVSYTVPTAKHGLLQAIEASGENKGTYRCYINGAQIATKRTYYTYYNVNFAFDANDGVYLQPGDQVTVTVNHTGLVVGDFDGRILVVETA